MCLRVLAHLLAEVGIGEQIVEVFGNLVVVSGRAEVSALSVHNLEGDTTGPGCDDGDTGVEGFGNFDLETFASGELERGVGVIQESIQDCRIW